MREWGSIGLHGSCVVTLGVVSSMSLVAAGFGDSCWVAVEDLKLSYHLPAPYYSPYLHIVVTSSKLLNSSPAYSRTSQLPAGELEGLGEATEEPATLPPRPLLGFSGDLVSRLSTGPHGLSYGLLWGLAGDTTRTYEVN